MVTCVNAYFNLQKITKLHLKLSDTQIMSVDSSIEWALTPIAQLLGLTSGSSCACAVEHFQFMLLMHNGEQSDLLKGDDVTLNVQML